MAVSSNSILAPSATPFDAVAWLTRFRDAGGCWFVNTEGRVSLGWISAAADVLWREVKADPAKIDAMRSHCRETASAGATDDLRHTFQPSGEIEDAGGWVHLSLRSGDDQAEREREARSHDYIAWEKAYEAFCEAYEAEADVRAQYCAALHPDDLATEMKHRLGLLANATDAAMLAALRWKLDFIISENGALCPASWDRAAGSQVIADLNRLMGDA